MELDDLSKRFPFQVPSYFALILRAFSVIEGIALRADPQYSIVSETFPYLARRLLTDNSPRTRAALRQLLYGVRRPVLKPAWKGLHRLPWCPSQQLCDFGLQCLESQGHHACGTHMPVLPLLLLLLSCRLLAMRMKAA